MIRKLLLATLLAVLLAGCSEDILYTNIDNQQLKTMLDEGVTIVDIRRPEEWRQTGVIDGSVQLTSFDGSGRLKADFMPRFSAAVDKNEPVVLICRTGNRTRALSAYLSSELGFTQIYNVRNGITSWIREGKPVSRSGS